jgi:hypothetical protein
MPKATAAAEDITRAVNNQDVLLVPKTVYVPFVAQTPVGTARLSGTAAQYVMPIGSTSDDRRELQQMIELVRRLNDRIEQLERNGKPGESAPCTTSASPRPLPRRPALQNSEPLFTCPPTAAPVERIPMVPIKLGFSQ